MVAVTTKLIRPTHLVLGADQYFQGANEVTTNNLIVNTYIVYKPSPKAITTDNTLKNCLVQSKQVDLMILQILINISILDMVLALITPVHLRILKVI